MPFSVIDLHFSRVAFDQLIVEQYSQIIGLEQLELNLPGGTRFLGR
jgi:hypothetical protein